MNKAGKNQEMTECNTRRLLKKKVLDRWENEGGRISAGPAGEDECGLERDHESEGNLMSGAHDMSAHHTPAPPRKKRESLKK
jgi:hypothetical protein